MSNIEIFFSKLFASIILDNQIVATVLYVISQQVKEFNDKITITINTDI